MDDDTLRHLITAVSLWSYKVVALVIGFLFTYLGYKLLLRGVSGGFKFSAAYKGAKADVISASPGIFFTLTGTIIIGIGLYKGFMLEATSVDCPQISAADEATVSERAPDIRLPRVPPDGSSTTRQGD
jgi:hypothetical protein